MVLTLIIMAVLMGLVILFFARGAGRAGWVQFYARGKDAGFSLKEIELLHRLAVRCGLENPSSLFWSHNRLDQCIRSLVQDLHSPETENKEANQDFLSRLYDFRKSIEMEKPRMKNGISNSRQLDNGQSLRVLVKGAGLFKSEVIRSTNSSLTISRPTNNKTAGMFSWQGTAISVYFWRTDDAGYVFDSHVQNEVFSKGIFSLKIAHADSLFRTQKRKSVRLKLRKTAFLYLVLDEEEVDTLEADPGIKCLLEDLSDTGFCLTIGGKASAGLRIKVQFALGANIPICMSGTVRSVEYDEEADKSVLHVQADLLPKEIRNHVLGEVFGTLPEEEEDLPARAVEGETEETPVESLPAHLPAAELPHHGHNLEKTVA